MRLGSRAVLLIGTDPRNRPKTALPDSICVAEYAPYSALFPRAALVVHQGGVGTTAQCLRAGKPMLIMPYSHDQPDNARRMRRLGVAKEIKKENYTPAKVVRKLKAMFAKPKYLEQATKVAEQLKHEDGVKTACNALEEASCKAANAKADEFDIVALRGREFAASINIVLSMRRVWPTHAATAKRVPGAASSIGCSVAQSTSAM